MTQDANNVKLDPDRVELTRRAIMEIGHGMTTLLSQLKRLPAEALNQELAKNILFVSETKLDEVCKFLGVETDGTADRDARYAEIRAANARVREMEAQVGASQSPDSIEAALKFLTKLVSDWWGLEGFGLVNDVAFHAYSCRVDFSCSLYGDPCEVGSDKPVSGKERKKAWHEVLRERGFVLVEDDRDLYLLDCDATRDALFKLFKERLPSARIASFENISRTRKAEGAFILRGISVRIEELADIYKLPAKPAR